MLIELAVRDLGVIPELSLVLDRGMTAVTGETGAGKTLIVGAIDLLLGGRAEPSRVRPGRDEAVVEGRFVLDGSETVLRRVVPREGRSRAYIDGNLATAAALAELGQRLVDLHGQHAHQSLLATSVQRSALDRFAGVDLGPVTDARAVVAQIDAKLAALGGDRRARAREADLLRFQVRELDDAGIDDPDEDRRLEVEEDRLAGAVAHLEAAAAALESLRGDGGSLDALGAAIVALEGRRPFDELTTRLRSLAAELDDVVIELRASRDGIEDDPGRLAEVRARRNLLRELIRKYGDDLGEVVAYRAEAAARLADLDAHDEVVGGLEAARADAEALVRAAEAVVGRARRAAAPRLAAEVEAHLATLAMPGARLAVAVGDEDPGDDVAFLLAANRGGELGPLNRVASGGELARAMLGLRLVLSLGPPTLVFDEVDAGIGGDAAVAVGRSLAALAADRQILVVTHLPQVAAFADAQVRVAKRDEGDTTVADAVVLDADARVEEISRMLAGSSASARVREAAEELLAAADAARARRPASRRSGGGGSGRRAGARRRAGDPA